MQIIYYLILIIIIIDYFSLSNCHFWSSMEGIIFRSKKVYRISNVLQVKKTQKKESFRNSNVVLYTIFCMIHYQNI